MLKVVVYGKGWGGELVANYLESELGVVEVIRVIDWQPCDVVESVSAILANAERNLKRYLGKVDVIVLGDYAFSAITHELSRRYPHQKFTTIGIDYRQALRSQQYPRNVVVLMNERDNIGDIREELRARFEYSTLVLPDCSGWEELINQDMLTADVLRMELAWDFVVQLPKTKRRSRSRKTVTGKMPRACEPPVKVKPPINLPAVKASDRQQIAQAIRKLNCVQKEAVSKEAVAKAESARFVSEIMEREDLVHIKPDLVLILNTSFWEIHESLEEVFGWDVRVIDFREKLLRDTSAALGFKGGDVR